MTSIGVPIHWAATEPGIAVRRTAAVPASNAAIHASRVSSRVPSTSKRTARTAGTSGLLLQPPDLVSDMVEGLDRLALLLPRHRRAIEDRAADGEGPSVLLVADPDDVPRADRRVGVHDPRGHDVRAFVDEGAPPHVEGPRALRGGEREGPPDGGGELPVKKRGDPPPPPKK